MFRPIHALSRLFGGGKGAPLDTAHVDRASKIPDPRPREEGPSRPKSLGVRKFIPREKEPARRSPEKRRKARIMQAMRRARLQNGRDPRTGQPLRGKRRRK